MRGYKPVPRNGEYADFSDVIMDGDEKNWVNEGMVTQVKD